MPEYFPKTKKMLAEIGHQLDNEFYAGAGLLIAFLLPANIANDLIAMPFRLLGIGADHVRRLV